jgi:hypothetical protein
VKKPLFFINETTWLKKKKTWLDLFMEIKEKKCMWFYLMMQGYQHQLCHVYLHTNVVLRHVDLTST